MTDAGWPSEDGWPYPDPEVSGEDEAPHLSEEIDEDLVALHAEPHLLDELEPLERRVVTSHFGLDGRPARSMRQLPGELGLSRAEVRSALEGGLAKLRTRLSG